MKIIVTVILVGATMTVFFSSPPYARSERILPSTHLNLRYAQLDSTLEFQAERVRYLSSMFSPPTQQPLLMSPTWWLGPGPAAPARPGNAYDSRPTRQGINYKRAAPLAVANAGAIGYGFRRAISAWGESQGGFHFKNDWKGDHLAQIDELSHFVWGYKMTQFLFWSYGWAGFSPKTSRLIAVSQTAFVLTMVEYPIDAYNPKQGVGLSDLAFDYAGIGLACLKQRCRWLENFDVKISWRKDIIFGNQPVFAQTYSQFDNFIYWLTYKTELFLPQKALCFGLGYGVTHRQDRPTRHLLMGIGLSLPDFVSLFSEGLGKQVKFLDLFYPNLNLEF
jgi:hypothetical protein